MKRASGGTPIRSVNPLVDIYNAASLRYALPVGAEDMDRFMGDLQLTITDAGDEFYLIGDDRNQHFLVNSVIKSMQGPSAAVLIGVMGSAL
ncbi:TPA: phenylalanine--tRNA ligase beta subunit-related protein [Streptococcus suis]